MTSATFTKLALAPLMGAVVVLTGVAIQAQTARQKTTAKEKATATATIDLNKATAEELEELPSVGPSTAKKIVAGRPYSKVDDLAKAGVPARVITAIRSKVHVAEATAAKSKAKSTGTTEPKAKSEKVNLNTADAAMLEDLPNVGPAHAKAIIAARPFKSVDDLERVKGLGKARIDALRDLVTTAEPAAAKTTTARSAAKTASKSTAKTADATTKDMPKLKPGAKVNLNTASKEELDALPGIGQVYAQAIIDARPFKTIEDVMKIKGIKEVEFSKIKDMITVK
jgi:competence protein ComEA